VARIDELSARIKQIEQRLGELIAAHPRARLVGSLPVQGIVTRATLLAIMEAADDAPWHELVARWGVAPITRQSGKSRGVRRRRGCDHFVCQLLIQFAHCTVQVKGSWARQMYYAKRNAGVEHFTALRQLANRWVKVLCAMWLRNVARRDALRRTAPPGQPTARRRLTPSHNTLDIHSPNGTPNDSPLVPPASAASRGDGGPPAPQREGRGVRPAPSYGQRRADGGVRVSSTGIWMLSARPGTVADRAAQHRA